MMSEKRYWRAIVHDIENHIQSAYELFQELREVMEKGGKA
jgi:hypothetical protein